MRKSIKGLYAVSVLVGLTQTACSVGVETTHRRTSGTDDMVSTGTADPEKTGRGRLGLTMPAEKPGVVNEKLEVVLESTECGVGPVGPGEMNEPDFDAEDHGVPLSTPDAWEIATERDQQAKHDISDCKPVFEAFMFDFAAGKEITIEDIVPGGYAITVRLFDGDGNVTEKGSAWSYVAAGEVSYVSVVLNDATAKKGDLVIEVVRAKDAEKEHTQPQPEPQPEPTPPIGGEPPVQPSYSGK